MMENEIPWPEYPIKNVKGWPKERRVNRNERKCGESGFIGFNNILNIK